MFFAHFMMPTVICGLLAFNCMGRPMCPPPAHAYNPWAFYYNEKGNGMNYSNPFDTENHTSAGESEQSAQGNTAQENSHAQEEESKKSETESTAEQPKTEKEMRDTVEKIMRASAAETQDILRGMFGGK